MNEDYIFIKTFGNKSISLDLYHNDNNDSFLLGINKENKNEDFRINLNYDIEKTKFIQILKSARFKIEDKIYSINLSILTESKNFEIIIPKIMQENNNIQIKDLANNKNENKNFKILQQINIQKKNEYKSIKNFEIEHPINIQIKNKIISLGINIGGLKTVYSIASEENGKFIPNVLLMNGSKRIIPSIICYTKNHRLFGDNSKSSLKQNLDTSYNNLSRIIGVNNLNEEELKYMFRSKKLNEYKFYCYNENSEKKEIKSEYIIADYLSLINDYYFEKEKYEYDSTCLSVPDFYNINQREELKLICEAIGMKDVRIINESSAITMYYGYTKYSDLFGNGIQISNEIDKNILFIDIGYSKTSIILSDFKSKVFSVKKVKYLPYFGGRYFDEIIANLCIDEFIKTNNIDSIEISDRMKYRLLEVIRKERPNLSINEEIKILVDSFTDKDLEIYIKKEK